LANFALTLRKSKKQMQMVAIVLLTGQTFLGQLFGIVVNVANFSDHFLLNTCIFHGEG
jgi:hypothetical protein